MTGLAPGCVSDTAELPMAIGSRRKCWNGPSCPWRARGVCLFGHEHDGPQTCVAPIDTVSREELAQVWKATFFDFPEPLMTEQLVNVPEIPIEVATPSSEAEPLATTHTGAQNLGNAASAKNEELLAGLTDCNGGVEAVNGFQEQGYGCADCETVCGLLTADGSESRSDLNGSEFGGNVQSVEDSISESSVMSALPVAPEPQGTNRRSHRAAKKAKSEREEELRSLSSEMTRNLARRTSLLAARRERDRELKYWKEESEREREELRAMEAEHAALQRLVNRACA